MSESTQPKQALNVWRLCLIGALLLLVCGYVFFEMTRLFTDKQEFLQKEGRARFVRNVDVPAMRGGIFDRRGVALAVNAPVASIYIRPNKVDFKEKGTPANLASLAKLLGTSPKALTNKLTKAQKAGRHFIYLHRLVEPSVAKQIKQLKLTYVGIEEHYQRYYPAAEVVSHVVGFTNIDGKGLAGLEATYDSALTEQIGLQTIYQDRERRSIERIRYEKPAIPGKDLHLTLDMRLQYLAYRELKAAVTAHNATSGSLVMLDVATGDILAMANAPSFNPNDLSQRTGPELRNRAAIDLYEPGSTMKPLTIAAAMASGAYQRDSQVDTSPGRMQLRGGKVSDPRNYGEVPLAEVIRLSSNVGASKIALSLESGTVRNLLENLGFGQTTGVGLQGEQAGSLPYYGERQELQRAQMAFGYGLSVTPLQLAAAYLPIAGDGTLPHVKLLKGPDVAKPKRVIPEQVAIDVRKMMETVVSDTGTARLAKVQGYRAAGKTGTVHVANSGGYAQDEYVAHFVGLIPATKPKVVMAIVMNQPGGQEHFGGEVSGPIFARVASETMRLLNVTPDNLESDRVIQVVSR